MVQIEKFLDDFPNALTRAEALDTALENNATAISSHYADLVALTARQTIGATELTVGVASDGTFNLSDVKMFMKNVGTDALVDITGGQIFPERLRNRFESEWFEGGVGLVESKC